MRLARRIPPPDATDEQIQLTKIENQRLQQELDAMEYKFRKLDSRSSSSEKKPVRPPTHAERFFQVRVNWN